jgi:hypothetical protein
MIPTAAIERAILLVRNQKVMLSFDLAKLYGVETRALVQAVKRNRDRFPADFMFQLSAREWADLKSQFVTSSWGGARRSIPYAFTEQGIAMLSSVLNSKRAARVNVEIMRTFVRLRQLLAVNADLAHRLDELARISHVGWGKVALFVGGSAQTETSWITTCFNNPNWASDRRPTCDSVCLTHPTWL